MLSVAGTRWRPKSVVIMAPPGKKSGLRAAVGFLTILPVSPRDPSGLAYARAYFPLVGLVLGALLVGLDLLLSGRLFLPESMFIALAPKHLPERALLVVFLSGNL